MSPKPHSPDAATINLWISGFTFSTNADRLRVILALPKEPK